MALRESKYYPGGAVFVKYSPDGGSFAYYPSGRMACAYERMGSGFYFYFYTDKARNKATLMAFDPLGYGYVSFEDGTPRLTSQKAGGTYLPDKSKPSELKRFTASKPPAEPIEFMVTPQLTFKFKNSREITATFNCQGVAEDYVLGDPPDRTDSYLLKSVGVVKMGPERGKQILDVDKCRQAAAEAKAARQGGGMKELAGRKKSHLCPEDMVKHPQLSSVVRATDDLQSSVRAGDWHVDVFVEKAKLAETLGDDLPTLRMGDSLRGDPHSQSLSGMPATQPDTLEVLLRNSVFDKHALPLSNVLKSASGRYRPEHGEKLRTQRRRLQELKARDYDTFINTDAPKGTLVVVCCLAGWLPQCRRVEPVLEQLNGEMHEAAKSKPAPGGGTIKGVPAPFLLCKFDMSESRFLRDRYNINTMPMYLMYYNGALAYASNTLNGFGTGKDDLVAQARKTLLDAQQGLVLPAGFKFSHTDNNLVASFSSTLGATAPTLGSTR